MRARTVATVVSLALVIGMAAFAMGAGAQEVGYVPPDAATLLPPCETLADCVYRDETTAALQRHGAYQTDDLPAPAEDRGQVRVYPAWQGLKAWQSR